MKYSISGRQPVSFLKEADEIYFQVNDLDGIFNLIELYPEKTIVYDMSENVLSDTKNYEQLQLYQEKFENFYIAVKEINLLDYLQGLNFKCFWRYPVHSFYELRGLMEHHPSQIVLGDPLSFDLDAVKNITEDIPLRMCANRAYEPYFTRKNGICGSWIRPEDVPKYEEYIDTLTFYSNDLKQEQTIFKIYAKDKHWPGNLNLLISFLDCNVNNCIIPEDFADNRLNCGQRCMRSGNCHACDMAFRFASAVEKKYEKDTFITI